MSIVAITAAVPLNQICDVNMRAVFSGCLFLLCGLIATGLFKNNPRYIHYIFIILVIIIALVSAILLASAFYITKNPVGICGRELAL